MGRVNHPVLGHARSHMGSVKCPSDNVNVKELTDMLINFSAHVFPSDTLIMA
jgi:hypothetical protein